MKQDEMRDEMRDDYIRMAKDAGCFVTIGGNNDYSLIGLMAIERFAQAVAAHERESCAKECDAVAELRQHPLEHKFRLSAKECATNIRRRQWMTPNDRVERPGAASGDRSARTTGCASNGTNNERTDK